MIRSLVGVLLAVVVAAALEGSAKADYWWGNQECMSSGGGDLSTNPCATDNLNHEYCWGPGFNGNLLRDAADYAMQKLENQTIINKNKTPDCDSATDVVWIEIDIADVRGAYQCVDDSGVSGNGCNKARVKLNPSELNSNQYPERNRKKTACHEVGHSGGLSHSDDAGDCMKSGEVLVDHDNYNDHHVGHLNDNPG